MDMRKWFKEAQYGMMVHWGLYSLLAGEYKDRYSGVYAEWIQANLAIPNAEYGKLAKAFNPVFFDAEEWVKLAKDCGMKYFVVTSKHHDGFAMFHSKVDKYNVVDATPFGRDVIGEIAEACYKHGLKMGLYYSQDLDWHHPDGGGCQTTFQARVLHGTIAGTSRMLQTKTLTAALTRRFIRRLKRFFVTTVNFA